MNNNLLIIGYCYLQDGFLYASKELEKNIYFFPYFTYILDNNSNKDDILIDFIKKNNINICLWWNNRITYESINYILNILKNDNKKCINYFYNWDPYLYDYKKYNCNYWKNIIEDRIKIYELMDHTFSCFETEINFIKNKISYLPPGFDENISNYVYNEKYICDISIVCTNIYDDKNIYPEETCDLHRYEVINKLYENRNIIKFHIYGNEKIKSLYPECYMGFITYEECKYVFSNSKINLSLHCLSNTVHNIGISNAEYFSERVPQILGCKGLLLTNTYYSNILKEDIDYIFINKNNYWTKIIDILHNYSHYEKIKEHGYNKAIKNYGWSNWSKKIINLF